LIMVLLSAFWKTDGLLVEKIARNI